jgi:hypothetical protein
MFIINDPTIEMVKNDENGNEISDKKIGKK